MPENEKVWVRFEREFDGEAYPVFLGDRPVNFRNGKSRPMKILAGKHYLLQCEMIGAVGAKLNIKEHGEDGTVSTVIDTSIPEADHPWKVCNGPVCRYLVFEVKIPGGAQ